MHYEQIENIAVYLSAATENSVSRRNYSVHVHFNIEVDSNFNHGMYIISNENKVLYFSSYYGQCQSTRKILGRF